MVAKLSSRVLFDIEPHAASGSVLSNASMAKQLMEYFVDHLQRGEEIDERVSEYVAKAFARYQANLNGTSYAKELGIQRRRAGNPGGAPTGKIGRLSPDAIEEIEGQFRVFDLKKHKRGTLLELCKQLAKDFGVSLRTIESRRTEYKNKK
ncbi:MAG TPA: hypothetical protein VGO37_06045 [Steroidobacteraceae bacterium]|jgi:hypothetical protein|nr:hypothetical protein [Steroidobacteraceae bacterium]